MMIIVNHDINNRKIAEVNADPIIINKADDALSLMGDLYYQEFESVILYEKNIAPAFFDLKTGMAGEILQKFSNYRMRLAIVGIFNYPSKSLNDFMYESNKNKHINFVSSLNEALERLSS